MLASEVYWNYSSEIIKFIIFYEERNLICEEYYSKYAVDVVFGVLCEIKNYQPTCYV